MTREELETLCASVDAAYPKGAYRWTGNPYVIDHIEKLLDGMTFDQMAEALALYVEHGKEGPGPGQLIGAAKAMQWLVVTR